VWHGLEKIMSGFMLGIDLNLKQARMKFNGQHLAKYDRTIYVHYPLISLLKK